MLTSLCGNVARMNCIESFILCTCIFASNCINFYIRINILYIECNIVFNYCLKCILIQSDLLLLQIPLWTESHCMKFKRMDFYILAYAVYRMRAACKYHTLNNATSFPFLFPPFILSCLNVNG